MNSKRRAGGLWWRSLGVALACAFALLATEHSARAQGFGFGNPGDWIGRMLSDGGNSPKDGLGWEIWGALQGIGANMDQLNAAFGFGQPFDPASGVLAPALPDGQIGFANDPSMPPSTSEQEGIQIAMESRASDVSRPVTHSEPPGDGSDPVLDGELVVQETDFQMEGPGIPYRFLRTYRSRVSHVGVLGHGWDHNYNRRIVAAANSCGDVELMTGDSGRVRFTVGTRAQGVIRFVAPPGIPLQLEEEIDSVNPNNNVYVLREGLGTTSIFNARGWLSTVRDAVGHQTVVTWEQAIPKQCPQGASLDPGCKTVAPANGDVFYRVTSVTDAAQRTVYYHYNVHFLSCIGPNPTDCTNAYATFNVDQNDGDLLSAVDSNGMGNSYVYHHEAATSTYLPDAQADAFCSSACGSANDCHNVAACDKLQAECVATLSGLPSHNPPIDIGRACTDVYLSRVCRLRSKDNKYYDPVCNSTGDHFCSAPSCLSGQETEFPYIDDSPAAFCNEKCYAESFCSGDPNVDCQGLIKLTVPFCTGPTTCYSDCRARYQAKDAQGNPISVFGRPEDLNHNLMEIHQYPSNRLVQANVYGTETTDPGFDKVISQQLGDGQIDPQEPNVIQFSYFDLTLREWNRASAISVFGLTNAVAQLPNTIQQLGDRLFPISLGKVNGWSLATVSGTTFNVPPPGAWNSLLFNPAQFVDDLSSFNPVQVCPASCVKVSTIPTETPGGIAQPFTRLRTPPAPVTASDWLVLTRTGSVTAQLGLSPTGGKTTFPHATWTLSRGFARVTVSSFGNGQFLFEGPPKAVNNLFDFLGRAVIDWTEGTPRMGPASEFARERELEWKGTRDRSATAAYEAYEPFSIIVQRTTETTAMAAGLAQRQLRSFPITTDAGTVVLRPVDRLGHYTFDASGPAVELLFGTDNRAALHLLTNNTLWIGSDPATALGDQYQPLLPLLPDFWNIVFPGPNQTCVQWQYGQPATASLSEGGAQFPMHAVVVQDIHGIVRTQYYDALGRVVREVNHHVVDQRPKETTDYNYDPTSGATQAIRYPSGQRSCMETDAFAEPLQRAQLPAASSPGNAQPIVETFAFSHGQMTDYTLDPSSATPYTVHVDYDFFTRLPSRMTSRVDALHTDTVTLGYDPPPSTNLSPRTITSASGAVTLLDGYDPIGPTLINFDAFGADPLAMSVLHDQFGRITFRQRTSHQYATKATIDVAGLVRTSTVFPDSIAGSVDTQYTYQGTKQPSTITSPINGKAFSYDAQGRPVWMAETGDRAGSRSTCFDYGADGRLEQVWLPDGALRVYTYDDGARVTFIKEGYEGVLPAWTSACAQSLSSAGYVPPSPPQGNIEKGPPPSDFHVTRILGYDDAGQLVSDLDGSGVGVRYVVDGLGRVIDSIDGLDNHRRVGYDARGRVAWEAVYGANPPPYAKPTGLQPGVPLQSMVEYQYDNLDRVVTRSRWNFVGAQLANPAQLAIVTTSVYDDSKNTVTVSTDGHTPSVYTMDGLGRTIAAALPAGVSYSFKYTDGGTVGDRVDVAFTGQDGRPRSYTRYVGDVGELLSVVDSNGRQVFGGAYDQFERLYNIYDGPTQNGATRLYQFDGFNRVVTYSEPSGRDLNFGWDVRDRIHTVQDANGARTIYDYNGQGQTSLVIDPAGNRTVAHYDRGTARVTDMTDGFGIAHTMGYDAAGRFAGEHVTGPSGLAFSDGIDRTFTYTPLGQLRTAQVGGNAANPVNGMTVIFDYDSLGRRVSESNFGQQFQVTSKWANVGGVATTTISSRFNPTNAVQVSRQFDDLGRVRDVSLNSQTVAHFSRESGGGRVSFGSNVVEQPNFDALGRFDGADVSIGGNSAAGIRESLDANAILRARQLYVSNAEPVTDVFNVDQAGRVIGENRLGSVPLYGLPTPTQTNTGVAAYFDATNCTTNCRTYAVDGDANWLSRTDASGMHASTFASAALNRYSNFGQDSTGTEGAGWGYDAAGNVASIGVDGYQFDVFGNLTQATYGSETVRYGYDALGRRVTEASTKFGSVTELTWDGDALVGAARDLPNPPDIYIYGDGADDLLALSESFDSDLFFYHRGSNGSTYAVSNDNGLSEAYAYSAFGEAAFYDAAGQLERDGSGAPSQRPARINQRFLYQGQWFDPTTRSYYMRAREYRPDVGRFLSPDPIGIEGGENLYAFVVGKPLLYGDPTGLSPVRPFSEQPASPDGNTPGFAPDPNGGGIQDARQSVQPPPPSPSAIASWPEGPSPSTVTGSNRGRAGGYAPPTRSGNYPSAGFRGRSAASGIEPNPEAVNLPPAAWVQSLFNPPPPRLLRNGKPKVLMGYPPLLGPGLLAEGAMVGQAAELGGLGSIVEEDITGSAALRPYGGPGGGHHVPAKSAFRGAPGYDPATALAIPNAELARLGVSHSAVTGAQMTLYRALAQTGGSLTWEAVSDIETSALVRGGMAPDMAHATVTKAIQSLQEAGVAGPTRIPWGE